ncbi:MAG: hypothetical protein HY869_20990 [Chloroflexi bacterium]|nr:hypothetical protein [Chloroflexota bacterium]
MKNSDIEDESINWNHAVYMLGKLSDVIMILVTGEGDACSRLREATPKILRVVPGMLPSASEIRERVEWAYVALTKFHDPREYAMRPSNSPETIFDSTLGRIKNRTGAKIIGKLFGAWMDLDALIDQHFMEKTKE